MDRDEFLVIIIDEKIQWQCNKSFYTSFCAARSKVCNYPSLHKLILQSISITYFPPLSIVVFCSVYYTFLYYTLILYKTK